jgi:transcriptional regulator GlxA family with amidase domain
MALSDVCAVVGHGVAPFELGVLCEVFGMDRTADGLPGYDFAVVAVDEPPLRTKAGFTIDTAHRLDRLTTADLVAIPAWPADREVPAELIDALRAAVTRGARVMSVCSGSYVLGAAGLLDGRRATTHWRHAADFAARFPAVDVDPDVLYVDDDPVLTSAGTAAGIDLALYLVRKEQGAEVANAIARRMVVPPHRDGGQAQFVDTPVPPPRSGDDLADVLDWVVAHLDRDHTVDSLAARAAMSPRTFARRFRAATGTTPHVWLTRQRVLLAQRLLEDGRYSVEEVARRTGFGTAAMLRHHFARERGTTPRAYARTFATRPASTTG